MLGAHAGRVSFFLGVWRLGSYLKLPCSFLYWCKLQTASVTHSHSHMAIPFDLNELPVEDEDSQRVEDADELDEDFRQVEDVDELDDDDLPVENGNGNVSFLSCLLCHY